jgi:APA family basic amino acid/polyamine antiporter
VVVKLSVVVIFIAVGIQYIQVENYTPFIPANTGTFGAFGWSGILRAAGVVFFAYIGFDAVSTAAQETNNPQRNIPIGILGSLFICTIIYIAFSTVMTGMVNYKELNVAAPVALAIDQTPYWWLDWLVKLAILAGFTSVILVLLLGQSRILYAMASDGFLPSWFAEIHPRYFTPWKANLVLMLFVSLFGAFAPISIVGNMTSIGTLFAFILVCTGVLVLRHQDPSRPRIFKTPLVPYTPICGILVCLTMMLSLEIDTWIRLFVWLLFGMVIYLFYSRHHTQNNTKATAPIADD